MHLNVVTDAKNRPPVDPSSLQHRNLLEGDFWKRIPAYANVSEAEFLDHKWQMKQTITKTEKLLGALQGLVSQGFIDDAQAGFAKAPMAVRVSKTFVDALMEPLAA